MFADWGNQDYSGDFPAAVQQPYLVLELLQYQERKSNQPMNQKPMNQTREEWLESAYNYCTLTFRGARRWYTDSKDACGCCTSVP